MEQSGCDLGTDRVRAPTPTGRSAPRDRKWSPVKRPPTPPNGPEWSERSTDAGTNERSSADLGDGNPIDLRLPPPKATSASSRGCFMNGVRPDRKRTIDGRRHE